MASKKCGEIAISAYPLHLMAKIMQKLQIMLGGWSNWLNSTKPKIYLLSRVFVFCILNIRSLFQAKLAGKNWEFFVNDYNLAQRISNLTGKITLPDAAKVSLFFWNVLCLLSTLGAKLTAQNR